MVRVACGSVRQCHSALTLSLPPAHTLLSCRSWALSRPSYCAPLNVSVKSSQPPPPPPPPHSLLSRRLRALPHPPYCTPLNGAVRGATAPSPTPSQPAVAEPTGRAALIVLYPSEWCCRVRNRPSAPHPQPAVTAFLCTVGKPRRHVD